MALYDFASLSMYNIEKYINDEKGDLKFGIDSDEDTIGYGEDLKIKKSKRNIKSCDINSEFSVEPVLLVKNDLNNDSDCDEIIIPDKNVKGFHQFLIPDQDNKTISGNVENIKYASPESNAIYKNYEVTGEENIKKDSDDESEIIYLSISDDETEDEEKEIKIKSIETRANISKCLTESRFNENKILTNDQVIYISDDEDVDYTATTNGNKSDVQIPLSISKSSSKIDIKKSISKSSSDVLSSSKSPSLSSAGDDEDDDGYDSNDQIIFFLNNQESDEDDECMNTDNEFNLAVNVEDHAKATIQLEEESKTEEFDNESSHSENNAVRRTTRRKTAVKAKCPCCRGSASHDTSIKDEQGKAKVKPSSESELSEKSTESANKKRKLSDVSIQGNKVFKKTRYRIEKMVTEVVASTNKKTNCEYYSCPICNYEHESKDELTAHWREKHSVTGGAINEIYDLLKMAVNNRKCKTCQEMLQENDNINKHIMWHSKSKKLVDDCVLCSLLYNKLNKHVRNHAPYRCRLCTKCFTNDIDLNNHLITHLYDNSEHGASKQCKLCTKTFNSVYDNVLEHLVMHHSEYNFITTDDLLNYKVKITVADLNEFKTKRLKKRNITLLTETKYICLHCSLAFGNVNAFIRHVKTSHNSDRQECKSCKLNFVSYKELHEHIRKRHKDINENFNCPGCRRMFSDVSVFRTHFKRHGENDIRNYNCPICAITLYNLFSLKRHLLVHTGEKPHQCEKCELKFRERKNLVNHMKAIHSTSHDLICSMCNQTFSCNMYLKRHMKIKHCKVI